MISIDKIIQHLQQCKDTSITIPKSNISKYVQNTAIDIRKDELALLNTNFEKLNEANYTMDSEFDKLNKETEDIKNTIEDLHKSNKKETIPNKSLIIYNENEIANLPEIITTLINNYNTNESDFLDIEKLYLYGIKNPDSFYKSFLLLSKVEFIIKNKTDQKNDVATFKREMAVQYESFYKLLNYRKLKFSRHNMVTNLTNCDNYNNYDIFQYISDYTKNNFIILDIIEEKYIDVIYSNSNNDSKSDTNLIENLINNDEKQYFILIKYSANTFLPLMNNSGNHKFNVGILKYITKTYERLIFPKYKEPKDINLNNDDDNDDNDNNDNNDNNDDNNDTDKINNTINSSIKTYNIDDIDDVDNIIENDSTFNIEEAFNNSIKLQTENSIIKKNNTFFNIEDMVDIEESEDIIDDVNKSQTEQDNNDNDVFDMLMNKIPIKSNNKKIKEPKVKSNTETKPKTDTKIKNDTNKIKTEKTEFVKEELLPMAKYNLADLQRLSFLYKIEIQKMGTQGKKINKLKLELYEELTNAKKYSNF